MGSSEMEEGRCKRHPKHRRSKGVCPYCLRERLSQISTPSSIATNASTSSSPYSSDTISTSVASPPKQDDHKEWTSCLLKGKLGESGLLIGKTEPLKKSRSLAFVMANPEGEGEETDEKEKARRRKKKEKEEEKKKKKKRGFWSKLLLGGSGNSGRRKDVMLHSRTTKETSSTRWFLPS